MRTPSAFITVTASLVIAGCGGERDGVPLAQLAAQPRELSASNGAAAESTPHVTLRRLWAGSYRDFYASSISPDGRYLSMIDWSSFNLAVRDLRTGELHRLTAVHNEEGKPWEDANVSVFSPDGRALVYSWQVAPDFQLRVLEFDTDEAGLPRAAEPRVIFHNPELVPYYPFDWSPDGTRILAKVYTAGNTSQLALISTSDGTYRALRSFDWREPLRAEFSPDGRSIAYDFPPEPESSDRDLFVVSLDGTYEARIVEGPAVDRLLGWHPGGDILFHSDRTGSPAVWRVPMVDGRPAGSAELVREDMVAVEPLGFAGDHFHYGVNVNPPRLYIAAVDFTTGQRVGPLLAVDHPAGLQIRGWDWSPDGKFLAWSGSSPGTRGSVIVIRSDTGEEVRSLRLDLRATSRIRWTPDGRSLIVSAYDARGRRGFHRIDLETGSYTTIVRNDQLDQPTPRGDFDISSDGRTLWFATQGADTSGPSLLAYDLESGAAVSIEPAQWRVRGSAMDWMAMSVARSPDATTLTLVAPDTISIGRDRWIGTMPVKGGPFTPLARVEHGKLIQGPEWTADGRFVVFGTLELEESEGGEGWETWIVPAHGGEVRPLELVEHVVPWGMKLHPDGRRIAFLAGESRGEVWVMDGLQGR